MQQLDTIFILGSGFSKALSARMPTTADLEKSLCDCQDGQYQNLKNFWLRQKEKSNNKIRTFEHLCYLILSKPFYFREIERQRYSVLQAELLSWIYRKIININIDDDLHDALNDFLTCTSYSLSGGVRGGTESSRNLVMTFNYDLMLESFIDSSACNSVVKYDYSLPLNQYDNSMLLHNDRNTDRVFEYLKLHGSFNWYLAPSATKIDMNNVFHIPVNSDSQKMVHYDSIPLFVPMSFAKSYYLQGTFFNILWNKAFSYLEMAKNITFIGYGFPESDIDNFSLFLDFKDKIKRIIVNDAASEGRLSRIFGKERVTQLNAREYLKRGEYR